MSVQSDLDKIEAIKKNIEGLQGLNAEKLSLILFVHRVKYLQSCKMIDL